MSSEYMDVSGVITTHVKDDVFDVVYQEKIGWQNTIEHREQYELHKYTWRNTKTGYEAPLTVRIELTRAKEAKDYLEEKK